MALNAISYPYPVYGNGDDIVGAVMEPSIAYTITDEAIQLKVSDLTTGHADIDGLVNDGIARWQIRVKCPRTYMRENFLVEGPEWDTNLTGSDYEGTVEIETRVLAVEDIAKYSPANAHEDYNGTDFFLKSGELLAIGPNFTFLVDKDYDPLKAPVASLLNVVEGEHDSGSFQLTLDDDIIIIKLSKKDWSQYAGIRDRVPTLLHSALVMSVLAVAITKVDEHQETLWSARLQDLIEKKAINTDCALTAAQEILDSPLTRTFDEVNAKLDRGEM